MKKYQHFKLLSDEDQKQIKGGTSSFTSNRYRCHYQYPGDPIINTFFVCSDSAPVLQNCPEGAFCILLSSTCTNPMPPEVSCPVNP